MEILIIVITALVAIGIIALVAGYIANKRNEKKIERGEIKEMPETVIPDGECCGQHAVCERDSLLAGISKGIEYYDDEELDNYRGTAGDEYTEQQVEQFRDILYTMKQSEVAGWCRSLQLRGIEVPDDLKDEIFLIVGERRGIK